MKPKSLLLLALALGCGLVATIGVGQMMNENGRSSEIETAPIYVALHNINVGDPIDGGMISLQEWPKDKIPPGAILQLDDLEGRRPRSNIIAGEPILEAKLLADGEFADPITHIPDGMRLATIAVDAEKSAAGLLSPGDRVDVQWYANRDERNGILSATTKIILQDIRVFAIEQAVQRGADGGEARNIPKTVSLVVTPDQAARVDLAQNHGELSLIPRNPSDNAPAQITDVTLEDILGTGGQKNSREKEQGVAAEQPAEDASGDSGGGLFGSLMDVMKTSAEQKPPFKMEIIRAGERTTMEFDPNSGEPLPNQDDGSSYAPPGGNAGSGSSDSATGSGNREADQIEDFPIDFGE